MCNLSRKLVAWIDGELPENEAASVTQHVASCAACRERLAAIEQASKAFNAYCDAAVEQAESFTPADTSVRERRAFRWAPVACGIGAIAAAAVLAVLVMQPGYRIARTPPSRPAQSQSLRPVEQANSISTTNSRTRLVSPPMTAQRHSRLETRVKVGANALQQHQPQAIDPKNVAVFAAQPPIEISVPAEDMFPPGAVPDGISYNAVVTFTADGVSQRFGNAPVNGLKAGFDRGGKRP